MLIENTKRVVASNIFSNLLVQPKNDQNSHKCLRLIIAHGMQHFDSNFPRLYASIGKYVYITGTPSQINEL